VVLFVWTDFFYLILLAMDMVFNIANVREAAQTLKREAKDLNVSKIDNKIWLIITTCDVLILVLFVLKLIAGLLYMKVIIRPPKMEYEFIHRGKVGHMEWRVQRVKLQRVRMVDYFIVSSVTIAFAIM